MNWFLDVFAEDCMSDNDLALAQISRIQRENDLSGPNEDDVEVCAPYIDLLPEESDHQHGSPLRFRED
jgi:hypothetical protein